MRAQTSGHGIDVHAVAGTHSVLLGFDLARPKGCLGFAICRSDHTEGETYWLRGMKTFASLVPDPPRGSDYSTMEHPVQGFQWGDYTAKPDHDYTYDVQALGGKPSALTVLTQASIRVHTELEDDGLHGIWFNRGVAGSQAFAKRFPSFQPSPDARETDEAMVWLSRGLGEAFVAFCAEATGPGWGLRGAFYEFTWGTGLSALRSARRRGVDLKLVVHGRDKDAAGENDNTAAHAREAARKHKLGSPGVITWRTAPNVGALMHNKFLVLTKDGRPIAVWTGSTNLTQGAVFGHSNVGHVIRDGAAAQTFLDEWGRLATDDTTAELRTEHEADNPVDQPPQAPGGVGLVMSPRSTKSTVLQWYSKLFDGAGQSAHITGAFGLNKLFRDTLEIQKPKIVRTVLLDKTPPHKDAIPRGDPNVRISTGAHLATGDLAQWAEESLTGFNTHVKYIHTKIVLVDPLTDDPTVLTGSANYSDASTTTNEENTVVIRAGGASPVATAKTVRRVADIYLTEYHRLFMHFVFRAWAQHRSVNTGTPEPLGHLAESDAWTKPYYKGGSWQSLQRKVFSGKGTRAGGSRGGI